MEMSGNVCANGFNYQRKLHPRYSHISVVHLLSNCSGQKLLYNVPNIAGRNTELTCKL